MSNALRLRLASREEPQVHPDADTLTAYLERLLPAPECNQVLEHLALCSQCRDVLTLSLPEQPELAEDRTLVMAPPARRGWRWILARPALGLAASVAGLAIVTTLILELPRPTMQKSAGQPASLAPAGSTAPAPSPEQPKTVTSEPAPFALADKSVRDTELHAGVAGLAVNPPPVLTAEVARAQSTPKADGSSVGGPYVNTQMFSNDASNAAPPANELPSAPAPRIAAADQNGLLSNETQLSYADAPHQTQSSKPVRMFTPRPSSTSHFPLSMVTTLGSTVGRDAKQLFLRPSSAPINTFGLGGKAMGAAGQFNPTEPSSEVAAASPPAGKDVTDLDQSRAFTARALAGANANQREAVVSVDGLAGRTGTTVTAWKVGGSKLLKLSDSGAWVEAYPVAEGIDFSVVSSHGLDIWAGGGNAALVHSRDGGATWERITLGSSATGTITSIEAGGLKLAVKSSSGQSWASPDGGRTWVLQD
ncbi:MAG TPA: YCF48-related protein [Candidatus Angelobacter sp.]